MRIAFFTDTYLPNTDGVVSSILNYRHELERRGHEVFIFSPGTKEHKYANKDPRVHYFTSAAFKPYPDYRVALINFLSPVKMINDLKIDVIHSHGIATTGLAAIQTSKKLGIKCTATFHTLVSDAFHYVTGSVEVQNMLQKAAWSYLTWYFNSFPKIIVPSNYLQNIVHEKGIMKTQIISTGIPLNSFTGIPRRKEWGLTKDDKVVLHVGRVVKEKNLELLIKSAHSVLNMVPNAKFVIAGKGPALEYYKKMVHEEQLDSQFVFTGFVPDNLLADLYASADCFAMPSSFETQGLAALEAMASRLPVVVRKNAAPAEVVDDGKNGYVFSDAFDLPGKIVKAIENKEKLGEAAYKKASEFDISKTTDQLLAFYETLTPCK